MLFVARMRPPPHPSKVHYTSIWFDSGTEDLVPVSNSTAGSSEPQPKQSWRVLQAAECLQTLGHLSHVNLLSSAKGTRLSRSVRSNVPAPGCEPRLHLCPHGVSVWHFRQDQPLLSLCFCFIFTTADEIYLYRFLMRAKCDQTLALCL